MYHVSDFTFAIQRVRRGSDCKPDTSQLGMILRGRKHIFPPCFGAFTVTISTFDPGR